MVNKDIVNRIKKEIEEDKRTYLKNCNEYYSDYIEVARVIFKDYYDLSLKKSDYWYKTFTEKALLAKQNNETESEKFMLEKAVEEGIDAPYPYERLAILYSKEKDFLKAHEVCKKWFNSMYWKIPNMAVTSLRLLDRMEKLEKKINKQ